MACRVWSAIVLVCVLAACGGGGGGGAVGDTPASAGDPAASTVNLTVSAYFGTAGFPIFSDTRFVPTINGLETHTPHCTLVGGNVPAGMRLEADCSITGRPSRVEDASFVVRLGAAGVSNTLDFDGHVNTFGPTIRYGVIPMARRLRPGQSVFSPAEVVDWSAPSDVPLTWAYAVQDGSLPPGVVLDPANGEVRGAPTSVGQFTAQIVATLTTPYGTYQSPPTPWIASVEEEASFLYSLIPDMVPTPPDAVLPAYLGQRFAIRPVAIDFAQRGPGTFTDFRILNGGSLPAGLGLDVASGMIHGTPLEITTTRTFVISANKVPAGVRTEATLALEVRAPKVIAYPQDLTVRTLEPIELRLMIVFRIDSEPTTVVGTPRAGACALPQGVTVLPTGYVTGVAAEKGTFTCTVDFELTHKGSTWTQASSFRLTVQ